MIRCPDWPAVLQPSHLAVFLLGLMESDVVSPGRQAALPVDLLFLIHHCTRAIVFTSLSIMSTFSIRNQLVLDQSFGCPRSGKPNLDLRSIDRFGPSDFRIALLNQNFTKSGEV